MENEQVEYNTHELESLQSDITLGDALERLMKNRDFKKLITEMYLETGSNMLTQNYWKVKHRENGKLDFIQDGLIARSMLYGFFEDIKNNANGARAEFNAINEEKKG